MPPSSKAQEWRAHWPLHFVALLGMAGSGIAVYSTGVFMGELTRTFGWSKTQYMSSMTVQLLLTLVLIPLVGRAIDRFGPRRVALAGIVPTIVGTAMLGLANGQLWQWWLLTGIQTLGALSLVPPVWFTAVVGQFRASRGLALAVALAGVGAGTALWPLLAAFFIDLVGWRLAYGAIALSWGVVIAPLTWFFFHGPDDGLPRAVVALVRRPSLLRSPTFLYLAAACGLLALVTQALVLHLVPILRASGIGLGVAASLAALVGACSIAGRLMTGFLLDILPARRIGVTLFLLPAGTGLLLAWAGGSVPVAIVAALMLGLAMGAESDVLNYIASRQFDRALFGSVASGLQTVMAVTAVGGTMLAARLADGAGGYRPVLLACVPLIILGALVLSRVPDAPPASTHGDA